jgi:hypothetical protein
MNESTSPDPPAGDEPAKTPHDTHPSSLFRVVEKHPFEFVAGAFLLGLAAAFSIPHHEFHLRERFVDEPLEEVKDLLHDVLASLHKNTTHALEAAESGASGAAQKIKAAFHGCCSDE